MSADQEQRRSEHATPPLDRSSIPEGVGYAASICHNPITGETLYTPYRTDEGCENPIQWCHALQESCEADFPGCLWTVAANEKAREIKADKLMKALGF